MRRASFALPFVAFFWVVSCDGEAGGTEPTLNFTLSVHPTALTIETGSNGTAAITIGRAGGFTGAVNLGVANLPAGVTASFDNPSPTGTAAILTLTVSGNAAAGTTNLSVDGAGAPGTRSAPLGLTLTTPPGTTTWKFCDLGNLPIHFAYQDGAGPWTEAEGNVAPGGTTYRFPVGSATGGVAFVEGSGSINGFAVLVYYGTQGELQALGDNQRVAHPNLSRTIHAFVTGVGPSSPAMTNRSCSRWGRAGMGRESRGDGSLRPAARPTPAATTRWRFPISVGPRGGRICGDSGWAKSPALL